VARKLRSNGLAAATPERVGVYPGHNSALHWSRLAECSNYFS